MFNHFSKIYIKTFKYDILFMYACFIHFFGVEIEPNRSFSVKSVFDIGSKFILVGTLKR